MRQLVNDLLTTEEKESLTDDLEQLVGDDETATTLTFHQTGSESFNVETGAVSESGGVDSSSVPAFEISLAENEMQGLHTEKGAAVFLVMTEDLSGITVQLNDRIVINSETKYIKGIVKPIPGIYWKIFVSDEGNN
jgi:hypothetical protein